MSAGNSASISYEILKFLTAAYENDQIRSSEWPNRIQQDDSQLAVLNFIKSCESSDRNIILYILNWKHFNCALKIKKSFCLESSVFHLLQTNRPPHWTRNYRKGIWSFWLKSFVFPHIEFKLKEPLRITILRKRRYSRIDLWKSTVNCCKKT